jgi:hypothetical protein
MDGHTGLMQKPPPSPAEIKRCLETLERTFGTKIAVGLAEHALTLPSIDPGFNSLPYDEVICAFISERQVFS